MTKRNRARSNASGNKAGTSQSYPKRYAPTTALRAYYDLGKRVNADIERIKANPEKFHPGAYEAAMITALAFFDGYPVFLDNEYLELVESIAGSYESDSLLPENLIYPSGAFFFESAREIPGVRYDAVNLAEPLTRIRALSWSCFTDMEHISPLGPDSDEEPVIAYESTEELFGNVTHIRVTTYHDFDDAVDYISKSHGFNTPEGRRKMVNNLVEKGHILYPGFPLVEGKSVILSLNGFSVNDEIKEEMLGTDVPLRAFLASVTAVSRTKYAAIEDTTIPRRTREKIGETKKNRVEISRSYIRNPDHARLERGAYHGEALGLRKAHWRRGHWRNQWYRSKKVHGRIWVEGHIVGKLGSSTTVGIKEEPRVLIGKGHK